MSIRVQVSAIKLKRMLTSMAEQGRQPEFEKAPDGECTCSSCGKQFADASSAIWHIYTEHFDPNQEG